MTVTVEAIYVDGVLKPLSPLNLQEHEQVTIQVVTPWRPPAKPDPASVTFAGLWPTALADALEAGLAEVRRESHHKVDHLAADLDEPLPQ